MFGNKKLEFPIVKYQLFSIAAEKSTINTFFVIDSSDIVCTSINGKTTIG
jgi:hypothetical protein